MINCPRCGQANAPDRQECWHCYLDLSKPYEPDVYYDMLTGPVDMVTGEPIQPATPAKPEPVVARKTILCPSCLKEVSSGTPQCPYCKSPLEAPKPPPPPPVRR